MAFIKRKCCPSNCGVIPCDDWCDCLPNGAHVTIELFQRYEIKDNGVLKTYGEWSLDIRNVALAKYADAQSCYLYATGSGGTWQYNYDYSNMVYPQYAFYIQPNCRGCLDLQQCDTRNKSGSGTIGANEVYLDCYDPCNPISQTYPTNKLTFDFVAPLTITDENYNECLAINGSSPPPYNISEGQYGEIYGTPGCLTTSTFNQRTLRWTNAYDDHTPHQDSYICTNINTCSGGCKGAYSCVCKDPNCSPPYLPVYDYWSSYTINSCSEEVCVDTHSCWNGYYGNQPAVYACSCNTPTTGTVKREYKHWMTTSVTLTIP
jgi:hypothetical protein